MEKKETEQAANLDQTQQSKPNSGKKKQKVLLIALIVAIVLAVACVVTAIVLKHHNPGGNTTTASVTEENGEPTTVSDEEAAGIEYVKEPYKPDYKKIASTGIKGDPDAKIKAYFFNMAKEASPELQMKNFDLLKVYEGFRIYDTTGTTDADGTKSYLLLVYAKSGETIIVNYEAYNGSDERAELLTEYIEEFDKNYERHAKYAKSLEGDHILYE